MARIRLRFETCPFPAFLAHTDRAPLIIGMGGLLPRFRGYFDYLSEEAWLEER
jgi:hypothetical protein